MKNENRNLGKRTKIGLIAVVLVVAILFSGCVSNGGTKPMTGYQGKTIPVSSDIEPNSVSAGSASLPMEQSIIGKWVKYNEAGTVVVVFSKDGTYATGVISPGQDPVTANGIYRFIGDNYIEVTIPVSDGTGYHSKISKVVSVSDDSLVLEDQETKGIAELIRYKEKTE